MEVLLFFCMFLVFEGLDGSGSTTQAKMLAEELQVRGIRTLHTSEPTDNTVGKLIRSALKKEWHISPAGLQLLFSADRAHHLTSVIAPALHAGTVVICDRYTWSTIAYGALDCAEDWLEQINHHFLTPDFTFLLQVPLAICLERIQKRGQPLELFEEEQKLQKVWAIFESLATQEKNCRIIDGSRDPKEIVAQIITILENTFPQQFSFS